MFSPATWKNFTVEAKFPCQQAYQKQESVSSQVEARATPSNKQPCLPCPWGCNTLRASGFGHCSKPFQITNLCALPKLESVCSQCQKVFSLLCYLTYILSSSMQVSFFCRNFLIHSLTCVKQRKLHIVLAQLLTQFTHPFFCSGILFSAYGEIWTATSITSTWFITRYNFNMIIEGRVITFST